MRRYELYDYLCAERLPHMWCEGCGSGIVLGSIARGLVQLQLPPEKLVIVTGIGCWGKADDYFRTNAFHGTHGRALAFATGIKVANPELTVIALMGDGDGATIGGNHLIQSARRNVDITAIIVNNQNYGMTGGQYSATTPLGARTVTSKYGCPEHPMDLCALVAAAGGNYVARGDVFHVPQMDKLILEAMKVKGFSMVEAISICPTHYGKFNKLGKGVDMMRGLEQSCISASRYDSLSAEEQKNHFRLGEFVRRDAVDFNTEYELLRSAAFGAAVEEASRT